ncbi:MAG: response regulator [Pseudomonadales bacterium]|nr:response regulator [Pseudomonadales bacterium]
MRLGRTEDAYREILASMPLLERIDSDFFTAAAYNSLGVTQLYSGLYKQALDSFVTGKRFAGAFPDRVIGRLLGVNMGLAYLDSGFPGQAAVAFREGRDWALSLGHVGRAMIASTLLAKARVMDGDPETALEELQPYLAGDPSSADPDSMAHVYLIAGRALLALNNIAGAEDYFRKGLAITDKFGIELRGGELQLQLVNTMALQDNREAAYQEMTRLLPSLRSFSTNILDKALKTYATLAAETGHPDIAYQALAESLSLQERYRGSDYDRKLILLEAEAEVQKMQAAAARARELSLAEARMFRVNVLLLVFGVVIFILIVVVGIISYKRRLATDLVRHQQNTATLLESEVARVTAELEAQMTERMQSEEDKRLLEARIAEDDKMRALGQLTGGIAHDYNNLLTIIGTSVELLGSDIESADGREYVSTIERAVETCRNINRGLLSYARQQPLTPKVINVSERLSELQRIFQQTVGEEVQLNIQLENGLYVRVDDAQLTTALINLLNNARDASGGHGVIMLKANRQAANGMLQISVEDRGCGMSPEQLARAHEPFFSTKISPIASGLGLSMVHGFAHQSGGHLHLESEEGLGTTITLSLPLVDMPQTGLHESPSVTEIPQGLCAVVVDDNVQLCELVKAMLSQFGFRVSTAHNASDAWQTVQQVQPDLLLSDIMMPGKFDGLGLAQRARALFPSLCILMMTGYSEERADFPVLDKPFTMKQLREALQMMDWEQTADGARYSRPARQSAE